MANNFPARLAQELLSSLLTERAATQLGADEEEAVLELASLVAHATERKNAPIACYVAGLYAGARGLAGEERMQALQMVLKTARVLLGEG